MPASQIRNRLRAERVGNRVRIIMCFGSSPNDGIMAEELLTEEEWLNMVSVVGTPQSIPVFKASCRIERGDTVEIARGMVTPVPRT